MRQEPRKSDAPQLRDEFRSYRTMNGTSMSQFKISSYRIDEAVRSRGSASVLFWSRGTP